MEPRSNRNERRNSSYNDSRRYAQTSNQRDESRINRQDRDQSNDSRRGDIKRVVWENDLYERQSI